MALHSCYKMCIFCLYLASDYFDVNKTHKIPNLPMCTFQHATSKTYHPPVIPQIQRCSTHYFIKKTNRNTHFFAKMHNIRAFRYVILEEKCAEGSVCPL